MTAGPNAEDPSDETGTETVLDALGGGGPAVTTGTSREEAENKPATVRDGASADTPAVAVPSED